jgi:hypothetical protein
MAGFAKEGPAMKVSRTLAALGLAALLAMGQAEPLLAAPAKPAPVKPAPAKPGAASPASAGPRGGADPALARGMTDQSPAQQVAQALQAMHLTACAGAVQQATTFLFENQEANFVAQPLGPDSDRWPTVFVMESDDPTGGGHTRFATLMITPNCSGMYEQTIYWPQPCASVKATVFPKFTGEHVLYKDVKVSDSGPALQVYLTPAGPGCISIKKELFH